MVRIISYEGALIDKVKAGDEREIKQMNDLQLYSWVEDTDIPPGKSIMLTGWARRMMGERSWVAMCTEEFRDNSDERCFCANAISIVSAWIIAVRSMV